MAYQDNPTKLFGYLETAAFPPCPPPHPTPLESYWTRHFQSPLTKRNAEGPIPETADIVVIGSGITGTCAATRLVERLLAEEERETSTKQLDVVVLDARDFCSGATGEYLELRCCFWMSCRVVARSAPFAYQSLNRSEWWTCHLAASSPIWCYHLALRR